ncbi:hypothetical protein [Streptomyces sp. NPDC093223]|uniref:hypothetical protein n=1 Tax=Streptomyces sp. NPDC093223 TaxID=3366033 RepID=UPI003824AED3
MRFIVYSLLAAYLLVIGMWPAAATPLSLTFAGLNVVLSLISGPALVLLAVAGWFRYRTPRLVEA